jgi:hypothetical protein
MRQASSRSQKNETPTHLRVRRVDEDVIVAKLRWINRWGVLLLVGGIIGAFYLAMANAGFGFEPGIVAASVLAGVLLICLGVQASVVIDVAERSYRRCAGFWPLLRERRGRLAEFERVELVSIEESITGVLVRLALMRMGTRQSYLVLRLVGPRSTLALEARSWGVERMLELADAVGQELDLPVENKVEGEYA